MATSGRDHPILKWGLTFGVSLGAIGSLYHVVRLLFFPENVFVSDLAGYLAMAGFFLAGYQVARRTGDVGHGSAVGLLTGVVVALMFGATDIGFALIASDVYVRNNPQFSISVVRAADTAELYAFIYLFLSAILGAGVGAIGGIFGRDRFWAAQNSVPRAKRGARIPVQRVNRGYPVIAVWASIGELLVLPFVVEVMFFGGKTQDWLAALVFLSLVAGVLTTLVVLVISLIKAAQVRQWAWFIAIVVLTTFTFVGVPGLGAILFGFLGPTSPSARPGTAGA